jgi:hypothetical protein
VYGRKVKAEEYIALWRSADKLTLAQTVVKGLIVVAELERNLEPLRKDCDNSYYRQENSKALARLQTLATCAESQHYLVSVNESVQKWRLPIIDLATYRLFRELRGTRWQGDDGGGDVCSCAVVGGLKESDAPGAEHTVAQEARGAVRDLFESEACCEL